MLPGHRELERVPIAAVPRLPVLDEQPDWLERLGPEPTSPHSHDAWLAEIVATVTHDDALRPAALVPAAAPIAAISR